MSETVDVYWSFRSPYSYFATPDLLALREAYEVDIKLRVVYPIAIRDPDLLFKGSDRNKMMYIVRDSTRRAEFLGLPFAIPAQPDPIVQDIATMRVAEEQPFIYRLSALGVEAARRNKGLEFIAEVSRLIFGGTQGWDQGTHLADATARAGLKLSELDAAIEGGDQLEEVERNQKALAGVGHWGVPTMVVRQEPFFGQDRVETLRWRLDQYGLKRS